jgi:conjugative relaxase-like TrwC/TraI family protein
MVGVTNMAGIITISPGHDASYPWRQIGTSPDAAQPGPTATNVAYYLSPTEKGGEPPGRWRGAGLPELGFHDGQIIDRQVFEPLYAHFLDPRDPTQQTRLGRAPQHFKSADEIHAVLLALEPESTAERRAELLIEAKQQVRLPVQYFDVTFSVSKSITLLHASALANAVQAEAARDQQAAQYWRQAAADIWQCIEAGNQAALDYLQREAGYTRSGYHGRKVNGVSSGRWEDAHGFVVGSFPQHTSRDGDPQLHIHNLVLNRVQRERDGAWRTLDSKELYEHRGAAAAIAALVMESSLSREFGVSWVQRADGHGREIRGVSRALMDQFSSRRQSISALTERLAREYEAQHGRAPDARALGELRQWANHATRARKEPEPLDLTAEVRRWAAQARASEAGALEPVAPSVTTRSSADNGAKAEPRPLYELGLNQEHELLALALATVQGSAPTWRKADLIRQLGELMPDDAICRDDQGAAALLEHLAERAINGAAGDRVLALEPPEWPVVPDQLRRADGRSIYRPHGGTRYATIAQLTLEERLTALAQERGAPHLEPDQAALLLGADLAQLEAQLGATGPDQDQAQQLTGCGLRLDQAAAAFAVLTSDRRAEILVGPAGSGKTYTAAAMAAIWQQAGIGGVYGLAVSQAARNVLHDAGVTTADNIADFLGHLEHQREARGAKPIQPRTLLILDEASTIPVADLAAIVRLAVSNDCRVLLTGDHEQLSAVEGGGGMMLLAGRIGFAQLAEPIRFTHNWERDASLRLRAGDPAVLADYDEHARLRGGTPEEAAEQACRAYVADYLAGKDALLLARTAEQARELSRRVRDDLIRYRLVNPHIQIGIRHRATASPGDLIVARRNDRAINAGQPGRWLANRDVLRIESADLRSVTVRRLAGRDQETGQALWSRPFRLSRTYVFSHCDLAYATTVHAAQGRTVGVAHALVDGLGDRQWLYVAMSRGRHANYAYCVTGYPNLADTRPGSRPAPELARARRLAQEADGRAPVPASGDPETDRTDLNQHRDRIAVLIDILRRDGATLSATETLRAAFSDADHLGILGPIWHDLTHRLQIDRYTTALRDALPEHLAEHALADSACTWLWRSLRQAEASGLDGTNVLREVIASRSLTSAREIARVLDSRVRRLIEHRAPVPPGNWTSRVPATANPDLARYLAELAAAMDDRVSRIGAHAIEAQPPWTVLSLGKPPTNPTERQHWQERAATIGAYRELYGYDAADAIGPEPGRVTPEAWADWHAAFAALDRIDGIDLRAVSDGQLRLRRATYQRELGWAPPHVAEELRLARLEARTAWENATRAEHAARTATDAATVARHGRLAEIWTAMHVKASDLAETLATAQETRREWAALTEPTRRMAVAADLELRHRYPDAKLPPLTSAEAHPADKAEATHWVRHAITADSPAQPISEIHHSESTPPGQSGAPELDELGVADIPVHVSEQLARIADNARQAQQTIDYLRQLPRYAVDDHAVYLGPAWDVLDRRQRDAIIQPPKPEIVPAPAVLAARSQEREADFEAQM